MNLNQRGGLSTLGLLERAGVLKEAFASRLFLFATAGSAVAYLAFFKYLEFVTGTPVTAGANYFVLYYSLIGVSSVLIGLNVFVLCSKLARVRLNATFGSSSAGSSLFGSVISCSCHASLLLPLLSFIGLSTFSGIGIVAALVEYQSWILTVFIVLNLYLVCRLLGEVKSAK